MCRGEQRTFSLNRIIMKINCTHIVNAQWKFKPIVLELRSVSANRLKPVVSRYLKNTIAT